MNSTSKILAVFGAAALLSGAQCRPATAPTVATPPAATSRPIPYPITESKAFARAVEQGTRTRTGAPGPKYWQQYARYTIDAELNPATNQLSAHGTIRYINRSPDTLPELFLHLNQNLFAPNAVRNEAVPITGGTEILRVEAMGRTLTRSDTGAGYSVDLTRLRVEPPRPLMPGDSIDLRIDWAFTVPPDGAPRSGTTGEIFMIAYWYPQMAVYDDVGGWQIDPYMGNAEFYMGYGDYEVGISLPAGWLVAATGVLTNPEQVLSPQTRQRLADARRRGELVHVVDYADRGAGRSTQRGLDNSLTWRFRAREVRDFSWGASSRFLWDATVATVANRIGGTTPDTVDVYTFYRPEVVFPAWYQSSAYARHSIEFLSRYLWSYPYPQMTAMEGPVSCSGMEYPMLTCIGGPRDTLGLYSVTVHEFAHMWFPMQVGSDERRHAWMDEGLTRFNQAQGMQAYFKGYDREALARASYLRITRTDDEVPLMRHGDQYPFGTSAYGVASYDKMATNMVALRGLLGNDVFMQCYRAYGQRWINRHPTPFDFWNHFNYCANRDLSWFWRTWWFETWTLDQAIASVDSDGSGLRVTIEDKGNAPMPVRLTVTRAGGATEQLTIPVDVWLTGARRTSTVIADGSTVTSVEIDPQQAFPDTDRANNRWTRR
ncbi:MAG TPA: M1 family metallopeptidase [Gemmatimonadaceae bacterium]|nr:M1 family metallopeptidase [Gemmatimonadaceae bacterium]